ncbi:MAG: hypothetical protein PVI94_08700 [Desulfobacterales bacterium]
MVFGISKRKLDADTGHPTPETSIFLLHIVRKNSIGILKKTIESKKGVVSQPRFLDKGTSVFPYADLRFIGNIDPEVAKVGGLQSQGVKVEIVVGTVIP